MIINMKNYFFVAGAILAGLAVAIGAYGAHGGAKYLDLDSTVTFGKAVKYQMNHAIGLLVIGLVQIHWKEQSKLLILAGYSFLIGVFLFSGSLYLIVFAHLKMGYFTPAGGILFVLGWFFLALSAWRAKSE